MQTQMVIPDPAGTPVCVCKQTGDMSLSMTLFMTTVVNN